MSALSDFSDDVTFISEDGEKTESESESEISDSDNDNSGVLDSVKASIPRSKRSRGAFGSKRKIRYVYAPKEGEPDRRISPKRMTKYEYARVIGERAEMISKGARIHPKYENFDTVDLCKIAKLELDDRSIPFPLDIPRPMGNPANPVLYEVFNPHEPGFLMPHELLTNHVEKYIPKNAWKVLY